MHFSRPDELTALQRRLFEAFAEAQCECAGWVVMPNHYHALLKVDSFKSFGREIGMVHGRSSHYANRRDGVRGRKVWYRYSDRGVRSERHYWTCLHYIIANPVKHGFAISMDKWAWSSYHELAQDHGAEWIESLRREYPLRDFGRQWDVWSLPRS